MFKNNPYEKEVNMIVKIIEKRLGVTGTDAWLVAMDTMIALDIIKYTEEGKTYDLFNMEKEKGKAFDQA